MKCHYGDNVHVQENGKYYTGQGSTRLWRAVYAMWKRINTVKFRGLGVAWRSARLDVVAGGRGGGDGYLFVNGPRDTRAMSTQLTGNTCYFQTYL